MNRFLYFLLCVFILLDFYLIYRNLQLNEYCIHMNAIIKKDLEIKSDIAYCTIKNINYSNSILLLDKVSVDMNMLQIKDSLYNVIYRVDFPYCENCIYPVIEKLDNLAKEIGKDRVFIITSFPDSNYGKDFYLFMKKYDLNVLNLPTNVFGISSKDLIGSYLFVMNKKVEAEKLFFVGKNNHYMLDEYFSYLKDFLNR